SSLTVALGGGAFAFGEGSAPLTALRDAGVRVVRTSAALAAAEPEPGVPLFGFFAPQTLDFAVDRVDPAQPSLAGLTRAALVHLDAPETGFALVIDAGRIGEAVRAGQADRALGEVLAAHEAVAAVRAFAAARGSMTLLVTAAFRAQPAGATRFTESNDDVTLFAEGAGAADLPELGSLDLVAVTAAARAALFGGPLELPTTLVPDGDLRDLRWRAADQRYVSNFGAGFNSLTGLSVDADGHGLTIGLSGAFERRAAGTGNAVIVLVDADFGRATGPNALDGRFNDLDGAADRALSRLNLAAPPVPGFGADFAFALVGGQPIRFNAPPAAGELVAFGGLRGVADRPDDFAWLPSTVNIAPQAVALPGMPGQPVAEPLPTRGLEVSLPWTALYPDGFPQRMRIGLIALLSNGDDCASNQFLPVLPNDPVQPCAGGINALPAVIVADLELSPEGVPAVRNIAIFP
ncbi:MAG: alkaline phosphatase, partial [Myxococcales bacterium]|nr:alkaline phosphatase [Myxococcales bacterium]